MNAFMKTLAATTVTTAINSSVLSVCMTKMNKCRGQDNIGDSLSVTFGDEIIEASYLQSNPSGQDFVTVVKGVQHGEPFTGLVVIDGHGKQDVIETLRDLDYREILEADNLLEEINKYICDSVYFDESKDEMYTINSGAVISVVQIFKNRYVMKWMGDCRIHIQVNGEIIASSSAHNFIEQDLKSLKNNSLVNRRRNKRARNPIIKHDYTLQVLDDNTITMKDSSRFVYPYENMGPLSFTRALGHCQLVGNDLGFETRVIPRKCPNQQNKYIFEDIIVYSDGIGDMVCEKDYDAMFSNTAEETVEFCDRRWKQEWSYEYGDFKEKTRIPQNDKDDMCIARWSNKSYIE